MSMAFPSPSMRAAASDLTVAISPLGLVELAEEEFEVHGPRLNRYASNLAWFLGHHWGYKREAGETQLTFNYCAAFSRYLTSFTFSRGVHFAADKAFEHITPALLKRVWEVDNNKEKTLMQIGTLGSVCGDVFVKVAYEPAWTDAADMQHPGRVRILVINPTFCFPEFHPHDPERLIRLKIKYRFWGTSTEGTRQVYCVDDQTEALTRNGWKRHSEIGAGDEVLGIDPDTKQISWQPVLSMHRFDYDGDLVHWRNSHGFDALTTPNHRWATVHRDRNGKHHWDAPGRFMVTAELSGGNKQIITGGGVPGGFADKPTYEDEFVELLGWVITEGHDQKPPAKTGVMVAQSPKVNPEKAERIRLLMKHFASQGATATEHVNQSSGMSNFYFGAGIGNRIREIAPDKQITPEFLCALTAGQAELLYQTMLDADGHRSVLRNDEGYNRTVSTENFIQKDQGRINGYQMLAAMLGKRTCSKEHSSHPGIYNVVSYSRPTTTARHLHDDREHYEGVVWCPRTSTQTWLARRKGGTFWTGNTYTEIITDETVEEYIDDELIDSHPNGLGEIPVIPITNIEVPGSPWGLSDISDIISLNREFNEQATNISEIIDYHAAPVTIITGAKASNLDKGPRKVWGGLPKDAKVFNLENNIELEWALQYLQMLKTAMHEMMGVPESALGQSQPVSNTSGVALSIQFQPTMLRYQPKIIQYSAGITRVNALILRTLFTFEPETLLYDPDSEGLKTDPSQADELDPTDPLVYRTQCDFPPPLPVDILIKLNELMVKLQLGLISKRGALRELGEEFPTDALAEIFDEQLDEAKHQGVLDLLKAQIASVILATTGLPPEGVEPPEPPAPGDPSGTGGGPLPGLPGVGGLNQDTKQLQDELVALAAGTKLAQRRNPDTNNAQET